VCLGHQLLALACGAQTYKLPYGHRGGNQPVKDLIRDEVLITAHNHGYAVDARSLPDDLEPTMTNLNDGTNEGFRHRRLPIAAVQFHPEASPGPFDARRLFAQWLGSVASVR
jgi:carbamoyl-phosphate synthase small subunit